MAKTTRPDPRTTNGVFSWLLPLRRARFSRVNCAYRRLPPTNAAALSQCGQKLSERCVPQLLAASRRTAPADSKNRPTGANSDPDRQQMCSPISSTWSSAGPGRCQAASAGTTAFVWKGRTASVSALGLRILRWVDRLSAVRVQRVGLVWAGGFFCGIGIGWVRFCRVSNVGCRALPGLASGKAGLRGGPIGLGCRPAKDLIELQRPKCPPESQRFWSPSGAEGHLFDQACC